MKYSRCNTDISADKLNMNSFTSSFDTMKGDKLTNPVS